MGAMYAVYDQALSAREIAEIGVRAGCEFDVSSSMPMTVYTVELAADKEKKDIA
ncbi:hypothetical protein JOS77_24440 [Chromobacterium haemolyticum]|nr:hypothetical protein JOS77_24440 [Chromobacterium haemolyticum]